MDIFVEEVEQEEGERGGVGEGAGEKKQHDGEKDIMNLKMDIL